MGSFSARKKIPNRIRAFAKTSMYKNHKLVLAGTPKMATRFIDEDIPQCQLGDGMLITAHVADHGVSILYQHCVAQCFVSYYGGYGFPIVEAMCTRRPVVCSVKGASAEVAQGHTVLVYPDLLADIAAETQNGLPLSPEKLKVAQDYAHRIDKNR